ncbi:MAG: glycoside hydrolase family 18 protein [Acidimicrobiales bacterium]
MEPRRRTGVAILVAVLLVVAGTTAGILAATSSSRPATATTTTKPTPPPDTDPYAAAAAAAVAVAESDVNLSLPATEGAPAPALPAQAFTAGLGSKDVVGFVPYYELADLEGESLSGFTYLVYSSVEVSADATLVEKDSANGWGDLVNGGASALVSAGHQAGDRVLLSIFAEAESVIGPLCGNGLRNGTKLAGEVAPLLSQYGFDGVDLDIEGSDASDRAGYVRFVEGFSGEMKKLDSDWSLMVNTYPTSAYDPTGFFDVKAIAPYVGDLFVMGYDMNDTSVADAGAPLTGTDPDDAVSIASYVAAGLGAKTVLGVPFYGYDFPVAGPQLGAMATGTAYAVTYTAVVTSITVNKHKAEWDPTTETPYTVFKRSGQWHQTWYENPTSIALKVSLAAAFGIAGVGAWELGMVEGHDEMLSVLDGGSPAKKLPLAAQPSTKSARS